MGGMEQTDVIWTVEMEVNLFHAMRGHKPAGVNRHFQMISIHEKLSSGAKKISSTEVWAHLSTLYDLNALYESEIVPFPNKSGEFNISEEDFSDLCTKSFPRTSYITAQDEAPSSSKTPTSSTKPSKTETKPSLQTPKTDKSSTTPSSASSGKSDSKSASSSSSSSSRDHKSSSHHGSSSSSSSKSLPQHVQAATTSEPSPKRGKRTRNVPSNTNSPSTPVEPPVKRRR